MVRPWVTMVRAGAAFLPLRGAGTIRNYERTIRELSLYVILKYIPDYHVLARSDAYEIAKSENAHLFCAYTITLLQSLDVVVTFMEKSAKIFFKVTNKYIMENLVARGFCAIFAVAYRLRRPLVAALSRTIRRCGLRGRDAMTY